MLTERSKVRTYMTLKVHRAARNFQIIIILMMLVMHGQSAHLFYGSFYAELPTFDAVTDFAIVNETTNCDTERHRHNCPEKQKTAGGLCEYICSISVLTVLHAAQVIAAPINLADKVGPKFDRCPNAQNYLSDPPPPRSLTLD